MSRRSSLVSTDVAFEREVDGKYDVIKSVADKIDDVTIVANADLSQLSDDVQSILDFTDITVVTVPVGNPASWDADTKILTIPKGEKGDNGTNGAKGDKGDTGQTGVKGDNGLSVNHMLPTSTTEPHGNFNVSGYTDTYTFYSDATSTNAIGEFSITNGAAGESNFTDTEKNKLASIEDDATADQTGSEIKSLYEAQNDTNVYDDADKGKVANLPDDTNAEKQDTLVSGSNIKTVNGENILGDGDLTLAAGSGGFAADLYLGNTANVINGLYKTLSYMPEPAVNELSIVCNTGETLGDVFLFGLPIETAVIDAGRWTFSFHAKVGDDTGDVRFRIETFMRTPLGVETVLFSSTSPAVISLTSQYVEWESTQPVFNIDPTAVYGLKVYAVTTSNTDETLTYTLGGTNATFTNTPLAIRHDQLRDRDKTDSHPISAITNLQDELDTKFDKTGGTIAGNITVEGNINQIGAAYETHAEKVFTTNDEIILRDGAVAALSPGNLASIRAKLYDGVNDGMFGFDNNGIARVGDEGNTQALATREDAPIANGMFYWNATQESMVSTRNPVVDSMILGTKGLKEVGGAFVPVNTSGSPQIGGFADMGSDTYPFNVGTFRSLNVTNEITLNSRTITSDRVTLDAIGTEADFLAALNF